MSLVLVLSHIAAFLAGAYAAAWYLGRGGHE